MVRPALLIALAALAIGGSPGRACAQDARGRGGPVRGVVRSADGMPVPYAIVALEPGFPRRFADDSGAFVFPRVPPGTYRLLARQIGFKPLDTTVAVAADSTPALSLTLERLVVELAEITVVADVAPAGSLFRCTAPGPPEAATAPDLAAVFDQLKQNAERYWVLADSYPVLYRMARSLGYLDRDGRVRMSSVDTLDLRTDTRWHYAPGQLVSEVEAPRGGKELQVNLPTLPDFADPAFDRTHCFRLAGLDTLEGVTYVRLDFRASERLSEPDADGSAYLEPRSYLIRRATIRLTHPDRALVGLRSFTAQVAYREIAPSIVIVDRISARQMAYRGQLLFDRAEEQRLLDALFLRPLPRRR
jgi:hypothetical protein